MRGWIVLALVACGGPEPSPRKAGSGDTGPAPAAFDGPPNVLILLADDVGLDAVGAYERHPDPPATPVIDGLAAEGVRFQHAWAYPICSPTRAAILTGRYGRRNGIGNTINAATSSRELRTTETLLPELLARSPHGYRSVAIGKWHLAAYDSIHGLDHPQLMGFEHFDGHMGNLNEGILPDPSGDRGYLHWERNSDGAIAWSDEYATSQNIDDALARIGELPEPWFTYLAFNAPHTPLHLPPDGLGGEADDSRGSQYRAMVRAMDAEIGRLLDGLGPELRARTVVIFAGDNGTSEQGTIAPWRDSHAKNSPYEGGVTVPLIVSGPGVVGGGREEDALVHLLDLYATVADLAGVPEEARTGEDGLPLALDSVTLLPYLTAVDAPHERAYVYTENLYPNGRPPYQTEWNILRDERYKLIRGFTQEDRLYDLVGDPHPEDGNENGNLLGEANPGGPTPEQLAAYERLSDELDRLLAEVVYEERTE